MDAQIFALNLPNFGSSTVRVTHIRICHPKKNTDGHGRIRWHKKKHRRTRIAKRNSVAISSPVQWADRPWLRPYLGSQSYRPTANRRPLTTCWHGLPTATAGGHCHLPWNDRLSMLPEGAIGAERVEQLSLFIAIVYACRKNYLERWQCNTATMAVWLN